MDNKGVIYQKFNLGEDYTKQEFIDKFGYNSTFPQVVCEHQKIGGMKDTVRYLVDRKLVKWGIKYVKQGLWNHAPEAKTKGGKD